MLNKFTQIEVNYQQMLVANFVQHRQGELLAKVQFIAIFFRIHKNYG